MTPTRTTVARRNPRARPAPKHPTVVLVRRFDPAGEELAQWEPLYRDDEGVTFFSPTAAKAAALNPPRDADLHVGDLIVTVPAEAVTAIEEHATGLYVVTPDGVKAAPKPPEDLGGPWLAAWGQDAYRMLDASSAVDRERTVMAACDCAETVLHFVPTGEDRPRIAVAMARAWCLRKELLLDVRDAAFAAFSVRGTTTTNFASASAGASAEAAADDDAAKRAVSHAASAVRHAGGAHRGVTIRALAPLVERWIPLPVVLLSRLGYPDAIPFDPSMVPASPMGPRENPRHPLRRRSRR